MYPDYLKNFYNSVVLLLLLPLKNGPRIQVDISPKKYTRGQTSSTSLVFRRMQIKTTTSYHSMPINTALTYNQKNSKRQMLATWRNWRNCNPPHQPWEYKMVPLLWKSLSVPPNVEHRVTIGPAHSTPRYIPSGSENTRPHKHLHTRFVSSGCRNEYHRRSGLNNRHPSCHSSGG